jgi:predicted transglutaminase-like cysteine proteinase
MNKFVSVIVGEAFWPELSATAAMAADGSLYVAEHGKTKPPIGFVKFCAAEPVRVQGQQPRCSPAVSR